MQLSQKLLHTSVGKYSIRYVSKFTPACMARSLAQSFIPTIKTQIFGDSSPLIHWSVISSILSSHNAVFLDYGINRKTLKNPSFSSLQSHSHEHSQIQTLQTFDKTEQDCHKQCRHSGDKRGMRGLAIKNLISLLIVIKSQVGQSM